MPKRVLEEFKVESFQLLDAQGNLDSSLLSEMFSPPKLSEKRKSRAFMNQWH